MPGRPATNVDKLIGKRIRKAREACGLTNQFVADKLDISYQGYDKYEDGTVRTPVSVLIQISKLLKRPVGYFCGERS